MSGRSEKAFTQSCIGKESEKTWNLKVQERK